MTDRILKPANQDIADSVTRIPDGKDLDLRVSRDPLALMPYSYMHFSQPMQIFDECGVSLGVDPRMIKTQDYPLTAPIFLYMIGICSLMEPKQVTFLVSLILPLGCQMGIRNRTFSTKNYINVLLREV